MWQFLKRVFFPNWTIVEVFHGDKFEYTGNNSHLGQRQNTFYIEYSKTRNEYRLGIEWGHSITADKEYHKANTRLAELNKKLLEK